MAKSEASKVKHWLKEIEAAEKREEDWRKDACEVISLFEAEKCDQTHFNILYANTETLAPALYSATPRPVVQRRYKDDDMAGAAFSKVAVRVAEFLIDEGSQPYVAFDRLLSDAVLSALVPGRGVVRFKYDAYISEGAEASEGQGASDHQASLEKSLPGTAEERLADGGQVEWETACGERVPWDHFCHGFALCWQDVPWIAYKHPMTAAELVSNFGEVGKRVMVGPLIDTLVKEGKDQAAEPVSKMPANKYLAEASKYGAGPYGAIVQEVWDKQTKKVFFICEGLEDEFLREVEDPLGLEGFFPSPEPLAFFTRVSSLLPQTLYAFYEEQAKELDRISFRINKIISALKVRGIYDSTLQELGDLFAEDDNKLLPADNVAALMDGKNLENSIWFLPVERLVQVLASLYQQRAETKQIIYELTGVADIMRGVTNPHETKGAQQIKQQWGNLRLRNLQKKVQRYAADCIKILLEIACAKFSIKTIQSMTGLQFQTRQEQEAAMAQFQAQEQQLMQLQQMAEQGLIPPEQLQQIPQPQPPEQGVTWEDLEEIARSDLNRAYRVTIETNSTVDPEAVEDQEHMSELMNALSQLIIGAQPLLESGMLPFEAFKALMLTVVRRFRFGDAVEETIRSMQAPQQQANPEEQKAQEELQKAQQEVEQQKADMELQAEKQQMQLELEKKKMELELQFERKVMELERKMQQQIMAMEKAQAQQEISSMRAEAQRDQQVQSAVSGMNRKFEDGEAARNRSAAEASERNE